MPLTNNEQVDVTAIKAKTDNLPVDPADASDVASAISTMRGGGFRYLKNIVRSNGCFSSHFGRN